VFTLFESDRRKAAFWAEAARLTGAPAKIICDRIELAKTTPAGLVTARALAPLDKLVHLALPHLAADGICLFPKGPSWEVELTAARPLWHMQVERFSSASSSQKCILKVSQIRHVGPSEATPQDHRDRQPERRGG
jgi:16S rRNA (guanine527-N7)-methyltransferase